MTKPMMDLPEPVENSADADLLRAVIGFAAGRSIKLEVGARTGAGCAGNRRDRLAQRSGSLDRDWQARAGSIDRRLPRL